MERDECSHEVDAALEAETEHFERWRRAAGAEALEASLRREMLALLPPETVSLPERVGLHIYYVRQTPKAPHACYLRRRVSADGAPAGPEQVVLDLNELAAVHGERLSLGQLQLSRCGARAAFSLEAGDGSEAYAAFLRELAPEDGAGGRRGGGARRQSWAAAAPAYRHLPALDGLVSLEWAADGATLLFTTPNALGRPCAVHAWDAGPPPPRGGDCAGAGGRSAPDTLFEEPDERFFVDIGRTKDWALLTVNCNSKTSSEVRLLSADAPRAPPRLVQARAPGLEYFVERSAGQLYILSNAGGCARTAAAARADAASSGLSACGDSRGGTFHSSSSSDSGGGSASSGCSSGGDYALFRVPADAPCLGVEHWTPVLPPRQGVAIEDMDMFSAGLVLYERHAGRPAASLLHLRNGLPADDGSGDCAAGGGSCTALQELRLPSWAFSLVPGANADYHATRLRLTLSSPIQPDAPVDVDLPSGTLLAPGSGQPDPGGAHAAAAAAAAAGGHRPAAYVCKQMWAQAGDGTRVPMTVAHAAGLPLDGCAPCLLLVYGAYGHCLPADWDPSRLPLLSRGWVLALAHVRGGGELGRRWHAAGRGVRKCASASDLGACLDALAAAGLTSPGRVALEAASAGALAAGGLLAVRPSDVAAALLEVPFLDLLTTMCLPELPLTVHEHDEWGEPSVPAQLDALAAACPYTSLAPGPLPPALLTCSRSDARVPLWGVLKYAARLREMRRAHAAANVGAGAAGCRHPGVGSAATPAGGRPVLVLADAHAGHFAADAERFQLKAIEYAFLLMQLGRRDSSAAANPVPP